MHTLTLFPDLLTFGMVAPVLLRLSMALFIIFIGYERWNKKYGWTSVLYFISAVLLIIGLYTQIGALLGILVVKFDFWFDKKNRNVTSEHWALYSIVVVVLISLIFTGPGFLAFDWPL
jgi:hypothetical protein